MPVDVDAVRADTPGTEDLVHLNNAGASLPPRAVVNTVVAHLRREEREGGYEAAAAVRDRLEGVYGALGRLLGCEASEVALLENATAAWNAAFHAIRFRPGDRILAGRAEYASNFIGYLQAVERYGVTVDVVPDDEQGQFDVAALERMLDERVRLVSLTHVPSNGGLVNPAVEVGRVTRRAGVLYLLDACQSVGQLPVDVAAIDCDMLSLTGRKYLRGPRGTGALFVRQDRLDYLDPPFLDLLSATWTTPDHYLLRPDARRFENWERNVAAVLGLGTAVSYALGVGVGNGWERIQALGGALRTRLGGLPGVTVRDKGAVRCGIVSFDVAGVPPDVVVARLAEARINTSISMRSSTLLDMRARGLEALVRASVHYYNTEDEVEQAAGAVAGLAATGR